MSFSTITPGFSTTTTAAMQFVRDDSDNNSNSITPEVNNETTLILTSGYCYGGSVYSEHSCNVSSVLSYGAAYF